MVMKNSVAMGIRNWTFEFEGEKTRGMGETFGTENLNMTDWCRSSDRKRV